MSAPRPSVSQGPHTASPYGREPIVVALVNNMSDAALQMTERQFRELLGAAAASVGATSDVRLRLFSFPEVTRGEAARSYIAGHYEPIEQLWAGGFDGLIVTGAEPRTAALSDEVYWRSFTRLVDWADRTATPAVWSCLAAHGAVLHLDGIERRRFAQKLSGVFTCDKISDHPLVSGMPSSWRMPHSRYNTLDTSQLRAAGYEILSSSDDTGPDTIIQRRRALFVFYQGHPEYDPGALLREYRRDVGRFLAGTMERYPEMPRGSFDEETASAFEAFRTRAEGRRSRELLDEFPGGSVSERERAWRDDAIRLYANWLTLLASQGRQEVAAMSGDVAAVRTS